MVGIDTIRKQLHFGDGRLEPLLRQWDADIVNFYEDRDINESRLKAWIEEIGFVYEDGKLQSYKDNEGKMVRKQTAEKRMEEDDG